MQLIPVERWTFWGGVLVLVASFVVGTLVGVTYNPSSGMSTDPADAFYLFAFFLFLISAVLGGSSHPVEERSSARTSG